MFTHVKTPDIQKKMDRHSAVAALPGIDLPCPGLGSCTCTQAVGCYGQGLKHLVCWLVFRLGKYGK